MKTWRHADGTVRVDHMDAQPGDYYGVARSMESDDIIEIMAREGMTDFEWNNQTFSYIKIQRERAHNMLRALTDKDYSVVRLVQVGWRGRYGIIPGGMDNDAHGANWKPVYTEVTE